MNENVIIKFQLRSNNIYIFCSRSYVTRYIGCVRGDLWGRVLVWKRGERVGEQDKKRADKKTAMPVTCLG